jgi:hypothetical protein
VKVQGVGRFHDLFVPPPRGGMDSRMTEEGAPRARVAKRYANYDVSEYASRAVDF